VTDPAAPDPRTPRPTAPRFALLAVVGAGLGLLIIGVRLATLPDISPVLPGIILAVLVTGAVLTVGIGRSRARMRAAADAYPAAVLIPLQVGTATSVATRWFAARTGDRALHLAPSTGATAAIDAAGLHLVTRPRGPHGFLPAHAIRLGPLGRTMIGAREVEALVLEVTVGDFTAPLTLVPRRLRGNPLAGLTDAELLEVTARIEDALAGRPVRPGWGY
jgi:hypothetical protein